DAYDDLRAALASSSVRYKTARVRGASHGSETRLTSRRTGYTVPRTRLMAPPIAKSSTRIIPARNPHGPKTLSSTTMNSVNDACPATNPPAVETYAATKTVIGRIIQPISL